MGEAQDGRLLACPGRNHLTTHRALTVGGSREACGTVKMRIGTEKERAGAYE
jgi:hypothetical protein